jgi:hypothetical protein
MLIADGETGCIPRLATFPALGASCLLPISASKNPFMSGKYL